MTQHTRHRKLSNISYIIAFKLEKIKTFRLHVNIQQFFLFIGKCMPLPQQLSNLMHYSAVCTLSRLNKNTLDRNLIGNNEGKKIILKYICSCIIKLHGK